MNEEMPPLSLEVSRDRGGCFYVQLIGIGLFNTETNIIMSELMLRHMHAMLTETVEKIDQFKAGLQEDPGGLKQGGYL